MLICWTGAETSLIKQTLGKTLRAMRPAIPEHKFIGVTSEIPEPGPHDVVLVCGTKALNLLQASGACPKGRTVTSMRETVVKRANGGCFMFTFDPGLTNKEPEKKDLIDWDLRLAVRQMITGKLDPQIGVYQWVNDFDPVIQWVEQQYAQTGKAVDVSMDLETETFFPWYADRDIVSISFTAQRETAHVLYVGSQAPPIALDPTVPLFDQIEWLLTSPKVKMRGANLKYDLVWIREKWELECTNFKFDSMLVGSLLDENRSNGLSTHAKLLTTMGGYDAHFDNAYDKSKMGEIKVSIPKVGADYLTYAGGDTDAVQRASDVLREELCERPGLANFYVTILHPAARAFEKVERRGVLVDQQKYHVLRDDLNKTIKDATQQAMELLPVKLKIKWRDKIEDQLKGGKSPLVPSILKDYFFTNNGLNLKPKMQTEKTKEPSMTKAHLKMFGDVPGAMKMVGVLTEMDSASKTLSTFVEGFLKHLRPDGKLHPTYFLGHAEFEGHDDDDSGTVTGRLSCKNPAFQTLPKKTKWAKRLRECYIASPGKTLIELDYSQGELRVVACVAPEKQMIKAYEAGLDLHAVTGAQLAEVELNEFLSWKASQDQSLQDKFEKYRGNAKPANFGLLYGMSAEGFQAYAWSGYGLKMTLAEAQKVRNAFFELYSGLTDYHGRSEKLVKLHEKVTSPLGRIRNLPTIRSWDNQTKSSAIRQAINSPIQSCLSDMMIWAISIIEAEYGDKIAVIGMIHDALIAEVDTDQLLLRVGQAQEIMQNLPFHELGWKPQLPFPGDAKAGLNLAQLKDVKLAA